MIIFDLDGTLTDCEYRRHLVDPLKNKNLVKGWNIKTSGLHWFDKDTLEKWKPDWPAFYEACDQDKPIKPTLDLIEEMLLKSDDIRIWSGRCESVRDKTIKWLSYQIPMTMKWGSGKWEKYLKMRPIADSTPDDVLKEKWLDDALAFGETIEYVFDDRPKVVKMWRRRGIFVFDVNQSGKEF